MLYLAPNKKILGIFGHGRRPLPFCVIDSHDPKNSVSEVPVNCYTFSSAILTRKSFGSGFHLFIYCSLKGQGGLLHLPSALGAKKVFTGVVAGHKLQRTWKRVFLSTG